MVYLIIFRLFTTNYLRNGYYYTNVFNVIIALVPHCIIIYFDLVATSNQQLIHGSPALFNCQIVFGHKFIHFQVTNKNDNMQSQPHLSISTSPLQLGRAIASQYHTIIKPYLVSYQTRSLEKIFISQPPLMSIAAQCLPKKCRLLSVTSSIISSSSLCPLFKLSLIYIIP